MRNNGKQQTEKKLKNAQIIFLLFIYLKMEYESRKLYDRTKMFEKVISLRKITISLPL